MKRNGTIIALSLIGVVLIAGVLATRWSQIQKHRVVITYPDGTAAGNSATVTLVVSSAPNPPWKTSANKDGIAFIPPERASGRNWDWMSISAERDGRIYVAQVYSGEVAYPLHVTLKEHQPPPPSPPSKVEAALQKAERVLEGGKAFYDLSKELGR